MSFVAVAVAAAVIGAGISAYSASAQADAQKKQADYQSKVAANNAKIAAWQRSESLQRGEAEAQAAMREQAALVGRQRAALAANGVDVTEGSALDLIASTRFLGQMDVNTIQANAAREAWGADVQGMNYTADSNLNRWKADSINPTMTGVLTGASSLLSSASSYGLMKAGSGSTGGKASGSSMGYDV
jgi:hypothetical protein